MNGYSFNQRIINKLGGMNALKVLCCLVLIIQFSFILVINSCVNPEYILRKVDEENDYTENMVELIEIIDDRTENHELRLFAMRSAGLIAKQMGKSEELANVLNTVILEQDEEIRIWAAWAAGESRSLAAIPGLLKVLISTKNDYVAYAIIESLWKLSPLYVSEHELNYSVFEALMVYEGNQMDPPPVLFYVLNDQLSNIYTLLQLMENQCATTNNLNSCYNAAHRILTYMKNNADIISDNYTSYQMTLERLINQNIETLGFRDRYISLLILWSFGSFLDHRSFASLTETIAQKLISLIEDKEPCYRLFTLWAMLRLQLYSGKAKELILSSLNNETEEQILDLISVFYTAPYKDEIQLLLGY